MLGGGISQEDEKNICHDIEHMYCYSFQAWHMNDQYGAIPDEDYYLQVKQVINEEIFHMYTHALAKVFPEAIGDSDFTSSVSCREMARL